MGCLVLMPEILFYSLIRVNVVSITNFPFHEKPIVGWSQYISAVKVKVNRK